MIKQVFPSEVPKIGRKIRITIANGDVTETTVLSRTLDSTGKIRRISVEIHYFSLANAGLNYYIDKKIWMWCQRKQPLMAQESNSPKDYEEIPATIEIID